MDQFTRRLVGFGVHRGPVDAPSLCRMFNAAIHGAGRAATPASGSAPSARAVPAGSPADHALCARLRRSWRRAAPGIPHRLA